MDSKRKSATSSQAANETVPLRKEEFDKITNSNRDKAKEVLRDFHKKCGSCKGFNRLANGDGFVQKLWEKWQEKQNVNLEEKKYATSEFIGKDKEQFTDFAFSHTEVTLNNIVTLNIPTGNIGDKPLPVIAAMYNDLLRVEFGFYVSRSWELISLPNEQSYVGNGASAAAKGIKKTSSETTLTKNKQVHSTFGGIWIGTQLHSRHGKNCVRKIFLHIDDSHQTAEVYYRNTSGEMEHFEKGSLSQGVDGLQVFIQFEKQIGNDKNYIARLLFCLARKTNVEKKLYGSYSGFSIQNRDPIGGAIYFEKNHNLKSTQKGIEKEVVNYFIPEQKVEAGEQKGDTKKGKDNTKKQEADATQVDKMWRDEHLDELKHAFDTYLDLPNLSLSKQLRARFWGYGINSELDGHFVTIGIGSGGSNQKALDTLIAYPMFFRDGICISFEPKKNKRITSPVRTVGYRGKHIWLHLRPESTFENTSENTPVSDQPSITASSYYIDDEFQDEYRGISARINAANILQGRREVLIRLGDYDEKELAQMKIKKYKFKDDFDKEDKKYADYGSYSELKTRYSEKYSFLKELIDHFEFLQTQTATLGKANLEPNTFIFQSNNRR